MSYEINVAKKRKGTSGFEHFFATAPRSLTTIDKAVEVGKVIKELFPFPEYNITISYNPETSSGTTIEGFLDDPLMLCKSFKK